MEVVEAAASANDDESQNQSIFQLIFYTTLLLNVIATKSMATVCKFKHLASDNLIFNIRNTHTKRMWALQKSKRA